MRHVDAYLYFRRPAKVLVLLAAVMSISASMAQAASFRTLSSNLSADTIAENALCIAEQTQTSGYCYAAICRALRPLGIVLTGESAYMASAILLKDDRFLPLNIENPADMRRGDIVVYNNSQRHPHGHIAVYEGYMTEASDHISEITSPQAYGGAIVFRLQAGADIADLQRSGLTVLPASIPVAPDFHLQGGFRSNPYQSATSNNSAIAHMAPAASPPKYSSAKLNSFGRSVARRCIQFILRQI